MGNSGLGSSFSYVQLEFLFLSGVSYPVPSSTLLALKTGSHIAAAGLKLRLISISWFSGLRLPNSEIAGIYHQT